MEEDDGERGQVIKGPWKRRQVKQPDEAQRDLLIKQEFAEELTQELVVHMIQMCNDNEIDVSDEIFLRDVGIIIEFTRGMVYRAMKMRYPTQTIVDTFVNVSLDPDGMKHTEVDMEHLNKYIAIFQREDDDDPS